MTNNRNDLNGIFSNNRDSFRSWVDPESGEVRQGLLLSPEEINQTMQQQAVNAARRQYMHEKTELSDEVSMLAHGKGFNRNNLQYMRKLYRCFPICTTLSCKLSWSHYIVTPRTCHRN